MHNSTVTDRVFKTVILAFLVLSVLTQLLVSAWFYDKLKGLESRLSLYPVEKPIDVDLRVTIPELIEIDQKIDRLNQRLDTLRVPQVERPVAQEKTGSERSSKSASKKASPRGSTQVDLVEKIGN